MTTMTTTRQPCKICGSTRSERVSLFGTGDVVCVANRNGRDRCRERELAKAIAETTADIAARVSAACRCSTNTVCLAHTGYTDSYDTGMTNRGK